MPELPDRAALVAGFRRLRPVIHAWLARDLAGTPGEYTLALADLTLGFGFARLGAVSEARECVLDAQTVLAASANETHHWLLRLYRYRIDEALCGNRHGGLVPEGLAPPDMDEIRRLAGGDRNAPILLQRYVFDRFVCLSRVLDPEGCWSDLVMWKTLQDERDRTLQRLGTMKDPTQIATGVRAFLSSVEDLEATERLVNWRRAFPIAWRACPELAAELTLTVPYLIPSNRPQKASPDWRSQVVGLLRRAIEVAAGRRDAEPFPPLIDAVIRLAGGQTERGERYLILAHLGWPCLHWFRKLDFAEECARFLHLTASLWPEAPTPVGLEELPSEERQPILAATLANACFRTGCSDEQYLRDALDLAAGALGTQPQFQPWAPKDLIEAAAACARGAGLLPVCDEAFTRLESLLTKLPRMPDHWTTRQHYARNHFEIVEAVVLAFPIVGDF
jgi:hypothetical protein